MYNYDRHSWASTSFIYLDEWITGVHLLKQRMAAFLECKIVKSHIHSEASADVVSSYNNKKKLP